MAFGLGPFNTRYTVSMRIKLHGVRASTSLLRRSYMLSLFRHPQQLLLLLVAALLTEKPSSKPLSER